MSPASVISPLKSSSKAMPWFSRGVYPVFSLIWHVKTREGTRCFLSNAPVESPGSYVGVLFLAVVVLDLGQMHVGKPDNKVFRKTS